MHLIIPYASSCSQDCIDVLRTLKLPHLQKLLGRLSPLPPDNGDEFSLSPPHERAKARALGLPVTDGQIPWAALQASQHPELAGAGKSWVYITLCHWQVKTHHVAMSHLPLPDLSQAESSALLAAMQPYIEEDGITLHEDQPGRWLAHGELFANLACASPDRVVGCNLETWLPTSAQAAPLRRLQNEMQMLLYTHPVNDAREARGLVPVNSFWLSGSGALPENYQPLDASAQPVMINSLREAALAEDWSSWRQVWQELDANQISHMLQTTDSGQPVKLTLCGERSSISWQALHQPVWERLMRIFGPKPVASMLETL
jgi:hypothetical protein